MLFAGQIHLAKRSNAIFNSCLEFIGVLRVSALHEIRHLHRNYEDCEHQCGDNAGDEGVLIEKLGVPTQFLLRDGYLAVAGDYITR